MLTTYGPHLGRARRWALGGAAGRTAPSRPVGMEEAKDMAPMEAVGCIIDTGQDAKTEIVAKMETVVEF